MGELARYQQDIGVFHFPAGWPSEMVTAEFLHRCITGGAGKTRLVMLAICRKADAQAV
jgi:hypothetical protein